MLTIADKNGATDSVYHTLVKRINSKYPIVIVSWSENFVFNDELLKLEDYVLVCFCEYGWDLTLTESHIWGINSEKFPRYYNNDWVKFDNWVKENPPKLLLKRELLKQDVSDKIKSIEYPCVIQPYLIQSKEQFNSRPISAYQYWGRSNEHRLRIHGEIWLHAYKKGFQVLDNIYYYNDYMHHEQGEKWVTLWIPHYQRIDISVLMQINNSSKLSLSWEGAGQKCFRHMEAPVNSVMVMHKNDLSWSFYWDETNCILVEHGKEIEGIEAALSNPNLYDIYVKGVQNCDKYRLGKYIPFLENLINNA